ncbi:hypothetical protein K7H22_13690 [Seohaeicola saemankumensis]|uniref:hypothetical protein n=1 Tax=Seohaeicola saemankumensis TaxID=481181 RepID=UPI001E2D9240|nr:hypothetical protein [Seohaeicola saemankumensis]MCD1627049.1 hypothetical protein [Seohaeicola saemankumensis]
MRKKNITSRADGVTKDMQPEEQVERNFRIPSLGVTVQARSYEQALSKVKKSLKK